VRVWGRSRITLLERSWVTGLERGWARGHGGLVKFELEIWRLEISFKKEPRMFKTSLNYTSRYSKYATRMLITIAAPES
jgi:hypothetical protein